jgi:GAF domain-containing protein
MKMWIKVAQKYGSTLLAGDSFPKSLIAMPILAGDQVYGSISIQNLEQEHAFQENDVRLLSTLTASMGIAIQNAKLFDETQNLLEETSQRADELIPDQQYSGRAGYQNGYPICV